MAAGSALGPSVAWDLAWRRLVAACGEARRRHVAGAPARSAPVEYPPIAPPPTPTPDRPVVRDDLARLAALSRAYLVSHASAGPAITVALLVTSRGPADLAFGVNVLPGSEPLPPGAIAPAIVLEASRALLAPIARAGRFLAREGGGLVFEPAPGFVAGPPGGDVADDVAGVLLAAFETATP